MEHILSLNWLVFSPLIAFGLILSPLFGDNEVIIRRFSKGFACLHFFYTILFLAVFDPSTYGMSFGTELKIADVSWLNVLGISASFAVDGLSLLLVVLSSFIFLLAFVASKSSIRTKHKFYYSMMFLLQCAVLGVFCAKDMFLFFLFWELELIPMYFLISEWGSGDCKKSAMKFILYTFLGSMVMLIGMLTLYFYSFAVSNTLTSNIEMLSIAEPIYPIWFQRAVFFAFLIGFAIKIPIIPFHTWLPDAHSDAPTPVSMILAAILLKMGVYGVIRYNVCIFPEIFKWFAPALMIFAVINIVWAACCAIVQKDLKRIVAFSSISHMGIVLLGLAALNQVGLDGAMYQMLSHGLISAGLFMIVGIIYNRCKTRDLTSINGLGEVMPNLLVLSLPIILACAGVPLLAGFPGELMSFVASFSAEFENMVLPKVLSIIGVGGLILCAAYCLRILHSVYFSPITEQYSNIKDIRGHQLVILFILAIAIIMFGLFPGAILDIINPLSSVIIDILKV